MTIAKLTEILKAYEQNAAAVLADSACEPGKPGVVRLRLGGIQPVELYQVEHEGVCWSELERDLKDSMSRCVPERKITVKNVATAGHPLRWPVIIEAHSAYLLLTPVRAILSK